MNEKYILAEFSACFTHATVDDTQRRYGAATQSGLVVILAECAEFLAKINGCFQRGDQINVRIGGTFIESRSRRDTYVSSGQKCNRHVGNG